MAKKIKLKSAQSTDEDIEELSKQFPSFVWVLRDFMLKLQSEEDNPLTPKQYLDNAFKIIKGSSSSIEEKNKIRRPLDYFFHERDCCTLVRPTEEEKNLHKLSELADNALRPDFLAGI
jgi:hypothetical protein